MQIHLFAVHAFVVGAVLSAMSTLGGVPAYAAIPGYPDPADVKLVASCLADAAQANADPDTCIGRLSGDCISKAEKPGPAKLAEECSNREFLVWDAALNRDYDRLTMLLADANLKQALRDAQRDFFVSELKQCTFERLLLKDSPEALAAAARCKVRSTARQDFWLTDQIKALGPH